MATTSEVGKGYAVRIRSALTADGFRHPHALTESTLRPTRTAAALREIASELEALTANGRPLSPELRAQVLLAAGQALGMHEPQRLGTMIREASNDRYTELLNQIWALLSAKGS